MEVAASSPTLANPFAQPIPPVSAFPVWMPYSPSSSLSISAVAPDIRPSIVQQYSMNLQTAFANDFLLEVGYVGTRGTHLFRERAPNQALLASPSDPIRGQTTNTLANIPLRVPIEGFGATGIGNIDSAGASWCNGLEVSITKRLSKGLQIPRFLHFCEIVGHGRGKRGGRLRCSDHHWQPKQSPESLRAQLL